MSQEALEYQGEQYVILVRRGSPSSRETLCRRTSFTLADARGLQKRLQEQFHWCDVEVFYSPERGVMLCPEEVV
jgi:hypothetical protein